MRQLATFMAAITAVAPACGDAGIDPTSRSGQVGRLNATIPARMVSNLDFEWRTLSNGVRPIQVEAIVPRGWVSDVPDDRYAAWLTPRAGSRLSYQNAMAFSVDCVGTCGVKDWPAVIRAEAEREVPADELLGEVQLPAGPGGAAGLARWGRQPRGRAVAYVAWAAPTDVQLRRCVVRLVPSPHPDSDVVDAIGVFATACQLAVFSAVGPAVPAPAAALPP